VQVCYDYSYSIFLFPLNHLSLALLDICSGLISHSLLNPPTHLFLVHPMANVTISPSPFQCLEFILPPQSSPPLQLSPIQLIPSIDQFFQPFLLPCSFPVCQNLLFQFFRLRMLTQSDLFFSFVIRISRKIYADRVLNNYTKIPSY